MKNKKYLLEFLYRRIDTQIKKYELLKTVASESDAYFNASLIIGEIHELIEFASELLHHMINSSKNDAIVKSIFEQTRFYVEQETIRAAANYLADPCIIHENIRNQIQKELGQLKTLAQSMGVDSSKPARPKTSIQHQCYRDNNPSYIDDETHALFEEYETRDNFCKIRKYYIDLLSRFSCLNRSKENYQEKLDRLIKIYQVLNPYFFCNPSIKDKPMFFSKAARFVEEHEYIEIPQSKL